LPEPALHKTLLFLRSRTPRTALWCGHPILRGARQRAQGPRVRLADAPRPWPQGVDWIEREDDGWHL